MKDIEDEMNKLRRSLDQMAEDLDRKLNTTFGEDRLSRSVRNIHRGRLKDARVKMSKRTGDGARVIQRDNKHGSGFEHQFVYRRDNGDRVRVSYNSPTDFSVEVDGDSDFNSTLTSGINLHHLHCHIISVCKLPISPKILIC